MTMVGSHPARRTVRATVCLSTALVLCALPVAAHADATIGLSGGQITVDAPPGEVNQIEAFGHPDGILLEDQAQDAFIIDGSASGECAEENAGRVLCEVRRPVDIDTGDGNDSARAWRNFTSGEASPQISADLGSGHDHGQGGPDAIDSFSGGPGSEVFHLDPQSQDQFAGGPDVDLIELQNIQVNARANPATMQIGSGGIGSDVENLTGGTAGDRLTGNDLANGLNGNGGSDVVEGGGGNDSVGAFGSNSSEDSVVRGGSGNDQVGAGGLGDHQLEGGDGVDTLSAGAGSDTLTGGPGQDTMSGGAGDDTVVAADGEIDQVSCGPDVDIAHVDHLIDNVANLPATNDVCELFEVGVAITSGPSGVSTSRDGTFTFEVVGGAPPPGKFECRIDGFGFTDCTSPKTFTNLPDGEHRFQVRYHPDGNPPGRVAERTWTVASCQDVQIGLTVAQGCFKERLLNGQGTGVFETDAEAWVGGFHLRPRTPDGKLVLRNDPQSPLTAEGAGVDWILGPAAVSAPLEELRPFQTDFTLGLNTAGSLERFVALPFLKGASAQVKVTWDSGGKGSKVEASVSIEELTKNLGKALAGRLGLGGTSLGTLAGKLALTLANGRAAEVSEGELEVPEYAVELAGTNPPLKEGFGGGKLKAKRVGQDVEWSGEVTALFPWASRSGTNQGSVTGRLFYRNFEMAGIGFALSGFEVPIGRTGWDLTGVNGDWIYRPATAFNVGVVAQQHTTFAGDNVLKLTGNLKGLALAAADCGNGTNPYGFVGTFNSPVLEAQGIGELKGQLTMCAYVPSLRNFAFDAGISADLTVDAGPVKKLFAAQGSAKGWFQGFDFNLEGSYRVQVPVLGTIGGDGIVSSEGYAFCARYGFISAGFATNNWLVPPQDLTGCDFTPFRAVASAAARSAGGGRTLKVPGGQTAYGMAVRGNDGAPRVRVTGPRGERFDSPDGNEPLESSRALIVPIDELDTTYVYLRKPRAGRWRIDPFDGDSIARIETSRQLPTPRVRARVETLKSGRVLVRWNARRVPGQRIELVERADGVATTVQRPTARRRGRVRFTPVNPLERRRTIEAVLTQNGSPRPSLVVARYRLRVGKPPARVRNLTATRTGEGLAIRWRRAARARDYMVTIEAGSEVLTRTTTTARAVTFSEAPAGALTVRIVPRDALGRAGRETTLAVD